MTTLREMIDRGATDEEIMRLCNVKPWVLTRARNQGKVRKAFPVMLTAEERATLDELARAEGISGSEYLRTRIGALRGGAPLDPSEPEVAEETPAKGGPSERVRSDALRLAAVLVKQRRIVPPELALIAYGGPGIGILGPVDPPEPLDAVLAELSSHRERYMGQGTRAPVDGWHGIWRQGDAFVGLYRPVLEQLLRAAGQDPRTAIESWKGAKVLIVGKDRLQIDVKHQGAKHRVVAFQKSALGLDPTS